MRLKDIMLKQALSDCKSCFTFLRVTRRLILVRYTPGVRTIATNWAIIAGRQLTPFSLRFRQEELIS